VKYVILKTHFKSLVKVFKHSSNIDMWWYAMSLYICLSSCPVDFLLLGSWKITFRSSHRQEGCAVIWEVRRVYEFSSSGNEAFSKSLLQHIQEYGDSSMAWSHYYETCLWIDKINYDHEERVSSNSPYIVKTLPSLYSIIHAPLVPCLNSTPHVTFSLSKKINTSSSEIWKSTHDAF
jgi:hypothetical protein